MSNQIPTPRQQLTDLIVEGTIDERQLLLNLLNNWLTNDDIIEFCNNNSIDLNLED